MTKSDVIYVQSMANRIRVLEKAVDLFYKYTNLEIKEEGCLNNFIPQYKYDKIKEILKEQLKEDKQEFKQLELNIEKVTFDHSEIKVMVDER